MLRVLKRAATALLIAGILTPAGPMPALPVSAAGRTIVVDDDRVQCPNADYTSIQAAVNAAASGDTIRVCAGTYAEQVTIPVGKNNLTLRSTAPQVAVIKAPAVMAEPGDIVRVNGARDTTIQDFKITGPIPDAFICGAETRTGIKVDNNGSAVIQRNYITEIRAANPALWGCQNGVAIRVGRQLTGQVGSAVIVDNVIDKYQKNGPTIDNNGSSGVILRNRISGMGPTNQIAQNGIQVGRGATAEVRDNDVTDNLYTIPTDSATGILAFELDRVRIEKNRVARNDIGIYLDTSAGAVIDDNRISDSTYDGIDLVFGVTGAQVRKNETTRHGSDGIFVDDASTGNTLTHNRASASTQYDCHDTSAGTGTAGTANTWDKNTGATDSPDGLCRDKPGRGQGRDNNHHHSHPHRAN